MERVSGAPPRKHILLPTPHVLERSAIALHADSACAHAVSVGTACGYVRGAHCSRAPCRGSCRGTVHYQAVERYSLRQGRALLTRTVPRRLPRHGLHTSYKDMSVRRITLLPTSGARAARAHRAVAADAARLFYTRSPFVQSDE